MAAYDGNTFSYDGQGRRISKNSIAYTYDGSGRLIASSNGLEYLYDQSGVFAVKRGESTYFYRKDAQGNIIALLDSSGNVVVQYVYDAWGNHAVLDANGADITDVNHIGVLNPFRYRGYFYDEETGLYFLKTRYYDPEIGRFITIDGIEYLDPETINGLNLYAYCINNPVNHIDSTGGFAIAGAIALIGLGALIFGGTLILAPKPSFGNPDFSFDIGAIPGTGSIPEIGSGSGAESWDDSKDDIVSPGLNENDIENDGSVFLINSISINYRYIDILLTKNRDPDPFKRPRQKKQGRELKNKARKGDDWKQRNGKRGGPKPPKHHTPGRDHRKKFKSYVIIPLLEWLFNEYVD